MASKFAIYNNAYTVRNALRIRMELLEQQRETPERDEKLEVLRWRLVDAERALVIATREWASARSASKLIN